MMFETDRKAPDIHREITIVVDGRPPSLNARRHWRTTARDNAEWKGNAGYAATQAVRAWADTHGFDWRKLDKVDLSVTFIVPTRARHDLDNLVSTLKPLLDGIVAAGVIADDSFEVIAYFDMGVRYEKGERQTIFIFSEIVE